MVKRFPSEVDTREEALAYYQNRAIQLLYSGWRREGDPVLFPWGVQVALRAPDELLCYSLYILREHCGRGHLSHWRREHPEATFVVMEPCVAVTQWLEQRKIPYRTAFSFPGAEYQAIADFYGDRTATRSGVFLMNHIDEGLYILKRLGADTDTMRAFCLHPLFQEDKALLNSYLQKLHHHLEPNAVLLALEYRNIANAHLSKHSLEEIKNIALSPLKEVNEMLKADKIQNRKDFERFHQKTHPQRERLNAYFAEWFARLEIEESLYQTITQEIAEFTGTSS